MKFIRTKEFLKVLKNIPNKTLESLGEDEDAFDPVDYLFRVLSVTVDDW